MKKEDPNNKNTAKIPNGGPSNIRKQFMKGDKQSFSDWSKEWSDGQGFFSWIFGARFERFKIGRGLFCLGFSFIFAFLVTFNVNSSSEFKFGEVAKKSLLSPYDFQVVDEDATASRLEKEIKKVPVVLDYYPNIYENKIEKLRESFSVFRSRLQSFKGEDSEFYLKNYEDFVKIWKEPFDKNLFKWLQAKGFSEDIQKSVQSVLELWSTSYMVNENQMREGLEKSYALIRVVQPNGDFSKNSQKLSLDRIDKISGYEPLEEQIKVAGSFSRYDELKVVSILKMLREPNLILDRAAFAKRKSEIKKNLIPIVIPVKKSQVIIKKGTVVQSEELLLINEINKRTNSFKKRSIALSIALILSIILLSGLSLLKRKFMFVIETARQDFLVLFSISFFGLVVTKLFIFLFEGALYQKFGDSLSSDFVILMSPFAMLFMLSTLLVRSKPLNWLFVTYFAVGLSFLSSDKFSFLVVALITGAVSVRAISVCRSRKDFYFSGFIVGAITGFSSCLVYALEMQNYSFETVSSILFIFGASLLGGVLSAIFTVTFVPLFESIYDIMTDLKLLELSSLSHPLLKDLMVRAPGTYHHCMVVGSMVEAACDEIGVNGLLGKVMAYFHDVGKMEHAAYFIENQTKGYNPHNNISPYLSKTIIVAHVKDGVELISKHKLGREILAGVKEHHGTTRINYFYNKALNQADENENIKEEDFRYPGPKPQFKESAILMLADSIEAAARTIDEPSPLKIRTLIDNMVDSKFTDGQLNECHITFSEITRIKDSFYKILVGVYHHRVEYPKDDKPSVKKNFQKPKNKSVKEQRTFTLTNSTTASSKEKP